MGNRGELLTEALKRTGAGGTVLIVAPDEERLKALMQGLFDLARAERREPVPWDDRTIRIGAGVCSFFTSETIDFVLEREHWHAARCGPPPEILWDRNARERAAEHARVVPDRSIDLSHLYFGKRSVKDGSGRLCGRRATPSAREEHPAPARAINPLLSRVMLALHRGRLRLTRDLVYYNNVHEYPDGTHVSTWFQTRGCTWDLRSGGCTMCNYARGIDLRADEMLAAVRKAFSEVSDLDVESHFVYSAGSTFDPVEVPPPVRKGIWAALHRSGARKAKTQARPEHVTRELVREFVEGVPGKELAVHLGLESSCAWAGRFCINRGGHPNDFARASRLLHERGVKVRANVTLGHAFLIERETVEDACRSTVWAFENGADEVSFLPVHVKPNTLLAELYSMGLYRPVSLWSLVEALRAVSPECWGVVRFFGWVSRYPDRRKIVASPTTCPICRDRVLGLLSECHHTWSREPLEKLVAVDCRCKEQWRARSARVPDRPLADRVFEAYGLLARRHGLLDWWDRNAARLEAELHATQPEIEAHPAAQGSSTSRRP